MLSLQSRIEEFMVTGSIKFVGDHQEGNYRVNDWKIVMRVGKTRRQYTFPMFTGMGAGEPTIAEALNCLITDAQSYFNADSFRDFCDDFGWDVDDDDERKRAHKIYAGCSKNYSELVRVFGPADVKSLLFDTESL